MKFFTRINLLIILILLIACVVLYLKLNKAYKQRSQYENQHNIAEAVKNQISEDLSYLEVKNTELIKENEMLAEALENEAKKNKINVQSYKEKIDKVNKLSGDSSYNYLNNLYKYNLLESRDYCFAFSQLKKMHIASLRLKSKIDEYKGIVNQYNYCKKMLKNSNEQNNIANKKIKKLHQKYELLELENENNLSENALLVKKIKRNKFWRKIFTFTTIGTVGYIAINNF